MLKACPYCGRVHDRKYDCGRKPVQGKRWKEQDTFRSSRAWQRKRAEIRERDLNLCRMCLAQGKLVCEDLSVHHIVPLEQSAALRLDDSNLITLCSRCHELAEAGRIRQDYLRGLTMAAPELPPECFLIENEGGVHRLGPSKKE